MSQETNPGELLIALQGGDQQAFEKLVQHYTPLLWSIARSCRLSDSDANDVVQTTWLQFTEHSSDLGPTMLGGWLATTARREATRIRRLSDRTTPSSVQDLDDNAELHTPSLEDTVLDAERRRALLRAVEQLPARCRELLELLIAESPATYAEISGALGIPIGSIAPTRARCLERLRRLFALAEDAAPSSAQGPVSARTITRPADEDMLEWFRAVNIRTVPNAVIEEAQRNISRQPADATTATLVSDSAVMPRGLDNPVSEAVRILRFKGPNYWINLQVRSADAERSVRGELDPPQRAHIRAVSEAVVLEFEVTELTGISIRKIPAGLVSFHIQTPDGDRLSTEWIAI